MELPKTGFTLLLSLMKCSVSHVALVLLRSATKGQITEVENVVF